MSDEEIVARWGPSKFPTAMSAMHREQQEAKATKKKLADEKKVVNELKKAALVEKRRLAALEKEKVSGMDAATKKAYLKASKTEKLMKDEPKLL